MNRDNLLPMDELDLKLFHFDRKSRELTAEASTIGFRLQQLFKDACDTGIAIRSHHTGKVIRFVLHNHIEQAGELAGWQLVPADPREFEHIRRVTIFND